MGFSREEIEELFGEMQNPAGVRRGEWFEHDAHRILHSRRKRIYRDEYRRRVAKPAGREKQLQAQRATYWKTAATEEGRERLRQWSRESYAREMARPGGRAKRLAQQRAAYRLRKERAS